MAREPVITQEQVNAAADALKATGVKPTARAVRDAVGAGSMATVLKFLQVWQAGQSKALPAPAVLPAGLQRALFEFIGQEVASARVELETELIMAQQANGDLIAEAEHKDVTVAALEKNLEQALADKAELSGRLNQLTADLDAQRSDALAQREAAESARTDVAKLQLRLEGVPRLESEIERLRDALEAERAARTQAEQAAAVAKAKEDAATAQVADLQSRIKTLDTDHRDATKELSQLRGQCQSQQDALRNAEQDKAQAQTQAQTAQAEAAQLRGELAVLRQVQPETPAPRKKGPAKAAT